MGRRALIASLAMAMLGAAAPLADDPLTRPITGADAARWLEPQAPARVFGNTSYLGSRRIKLGLVATRAGLVMIDAGLPEGFAAVQAQVAALGYDIADVRLILVTEPHYDHAGAIAALVRASGARVVAAGPAAAVLRRGASDGSDPQASSLLAFPPVARVTVARDGQRFRLGEVVFTARAMPGHTPGSMGWTWPACADGRCLQVVFAASLNPLATGGWRYSAPEHAGLLAAFRRGLDQLRGLPCDILLTGHADHSGADARLARVLAGEPAPDAFIDPGACRAMADRYGAALDAVLAREAAE